MGGVILEPAGAKRKAREIIVAPRLPELRAEGYKTPFDAEGDIVVDCTVAGCGWHAMGPRREIGAALREHHRVYHPEQTGVILLNAPRQ